ncbi:MAG: hypothetical protein P8M62_03980 [Opitutae bacterium]|nr:hypothetical protein [Opitutae bacterium]MDG2345199.1 hypothetical protein [Opitutae bacterium]
MHTSFDIYPSYLRHFPNGIAASNPLRLRYDIHAMRNYAYRNEGGKRVGPFPQVRPEGSLEISSESSVNGVKKMVIQHSREWSTWTGQEPASKQDITAQIHYADDAIGTLLNWRMSYTSSPILPVKSYRYDQLGPMQKHGRVKNRTIELTAARKGMPNMELGTSHSVTSLYTLIERFQLNKAQATTVDYLDDLTMLRPGLELTPLPDDTIEIEGTLTDVHGYALVGPAILPLFIWMDTHSNVLAAIGRNVAYTLTSAANR